MNVINMNPNKLTPYPGNAKQHPPEQVRHIANSIRQFGWRQPIVVDKDNVVIIGHGRLYAAKEMGLDEVPVVCADDLSPEQVNALRLADNKTNESEWDMTALEQELAGLAIDGIDMTQFGFEDTDFQIETQQEVVEDEPPEPPETPIAKRGDIWQLGRHRLMCGDSTDAETVEKLMNCEKADMVFTDPPYGMNLDTDYSKLPENKEFQKAKGIKKGKSYKAVIGDNEDFRSELVTTVFDNFGYCKEIFIWGGDYFPELLQGYKDGNYIVWDKKSNEGMENHNFDRTLSSNFELCWSKNKHKKDIVRVLWVSAFGTEQEFDHKRYHPTQKPTKLARWFIEKYSEDGARIVDIYGGSGSTLIACEQLNRTCYMMELDPHYCDVIIQRWENLTGEKAVKMN